MSNDPMDHVENALSRDSESDETILKSLDEYMDDSHDG